MSQQRMLDGLRIWFKLLVAALVAWCILLVVHPSYALLIAQTFGCSESSTHAWELRHYSFLAATYIATAFGAFTAINLWFLNYQDLREFPRIKRWLESHTVLNGKNYNGWLRYAVVAGVMVFFAIIAGLVLARRLGANKWIVLCITLTACAIRNFYWAWLLSVVPARAQTIASLIIVGVVVVLTLRDVKKSVRAPAHARTTAASD